jgi:hypothetical protein
VLNMMLKDANKYPVLNEKEFYKEVKWYRLATQL